MSGQYESIDLEKVNTPIRQNIIMILPEKLEQGTIDVLRKPSNHQRFRLLAYFLFHCSSRAYCGKIEKVFRIIDILRGDIQSTHPDGY